MLMSSRSFSDISKELQSENFATMPLLRVAILRNIMIEPLVTYLRYGVLKLGLNAQVTLGEYDTVFQEAIAGSSTVYDQSTDVLLVFLHLEGISWDLARNFNALSSQAIEEEVARIIDYCQAIVHNLRAKSAAMILWHGFLPPAYPALGIFDAQSDAGQSHALQRLNTALRAVVSAVANAYFVDMGLCLARVGESHFYDERYWHMARAPYTLEACAAIAQEDVKFLRARFGKNKKCLVLDCDNTLWGGIVGEDGLNGIKLGTTSPGSAYRELQQQILDLHHRGIILALCSKNNEADVWEVFQNHPGMVLKRQHFAAWRINWQDKATNIRELAVAINIGLDSMVFVDDSAFEVNWVRQELPDVEVMHLPKENIFRARQQLSACGLFDTLTVSQEDRARGSMLTAEAARQQILHSASDLHTYYKSLEMRVVVSFVDAQSLQRVAQLTQKTNQFNLTTRRYSDADIGHFIASAESDVLYIQLEDKFGDFGIIGVCILRYEKDQAYFDTFLLSCRALSRGVEDVLLTQALLLAKRRGATVAVGEYYATRKNSQTESFYGTRGFVAAQQDGSSASKRFIYPLDQALPIHPDYFYAITTHLESE
ncbi:HAD-IIIC family phosphatase [Candidatus Magnetaquicoccus inordinatus]|uniref:HAD-IIIC family phosphatase n=1 Tax=Candidatus Magnetaquicoccus inordinatus TaxID=2496818 RepID=UPI00102AA3B5|nr:HAD-IIIC family phosphatase [Candidatus Magnetaquicoccus inordinatus]